MPWARRAASITSPARSMSSRRSHHEAWKRRSRRTSSRRSTVEVGSSYRTSQLEPGSAARIGSEAVEPARLDGLEGALRGRHGLHRVRPKGEGDVGPRGRIAGRGSGLFIPPTIFDDVTPDMTISREEIFGPVLAVTTAGSDDEALERRFRRTRSRQFGYCFRYSVRYRRSRHR